MSFFNFGISPPDFNLALALAPPSATHWLGCDAFGRDLIHLTAFAALTSLSFALISILSSLALGVSAAAFTLSAPKSIQETSLRVLDFFLGFPSLLLALALATLWGPGQFTLLISLIMGVLPSLCRLLILRGLENRKLAYFEAGRAIGASRFRLAIRYDLPELLSLIRLKIPGFFSHAILAEASLSFLGVGAPIGQETWGSLLAQGKDYLIEAPQIAWVSGAPLFVCVLALQVLADRRT